MSTLADIAVSEGPWTAVWSGGRLADIFHAEYDGAIECVEVGDYDFGLHRDALTTSRAHLGAVDVRAALVAWIADHGDEYRQELPYLPR